MDFFFLFGVGFWLGEAGYFSDIGFFESDTVSWLGFFLACFFGCCSGIGNSIGRTKLCVLLILNYNLIHQSGKKNWLEVDVKTRTGSLTLITVFKLMAGIFLCTIYDNDWLMYWTLLKANSMDHILFSCQKSHEIWIFQGQQMHIFSNSREL